MGSDMTPCFLLIAHIPASITRTVCWFSLFLLLNIWLHLSPLSFIIILLVILFTFFMQSSLFCAYFHCMAYSPKKRACQSVETLSVFLREMIEFDKRYAGQLCYYTHFSLKFSHKNVVSFCYTVKIMEWDEKPWFNRKMEKTSAQIMNWSCFAILKCDRIWTMILLALNASPVQGHKSVRKNGNVIFFTSLFVARS